MSSVLDNIRRQARAAGFNMVGAIPCARYTDIVSTGAAAIAGLAPAARSIVVIGNGGRTLWNALRKHSDLHPEWRNRRDPIDDYTVATIERMVVEPLKQQGLNVKAAYPFMRDKIQLDFMTLGRLAGLGAPSILGVLIHPVYGPWIAFRAALLIDLELAQLGEAAGFEPCPECTDRPCIKACPPRAIGFPNGWDIPRCTTHRVEVETDCATRCHARAGCVIGPEHRYSDEQLAYHQKRALAAMRSWYQAQPHGK
jgi:epoxyqueuosine reductase